ncbi:tyrosinase family protein [Pseudoduganella dura]|nr:tyrosinase family protein [Pseudoduganella dura]
MSTFSRREFLKTGGLAAGLVLLPSVGAAAQNCVMTRYSLASNKGRRMLQTYADSVWRMNNPLTQPEASPRSWMFQWYTHMVRGDRGKAAELSRVYPLGGTAMALANEMWNTCQSHLGQPQQYFLPWHRMYLRYLEEIVRAVSGDPCFTMPYWDYTDPAQQALPVEFRQRFHPRWGALYREERYPEINAGTPLPAGRAGFGLNLDCMKSGSYNPFNGDAGFCANIDGMVHGAAHLDIGTQLGMATVPWAASDPVFWVHHCNIDRIWASWNRLGGRNPSDPAFLDKAFVFANGGGTRAETQIRDAVSVPAAAYDTYLSRPPGSLPFQGAASQGRQASTRNRNSRPRWRRTRPGWMATSISATRRRPWRWSPAPPSTASRPARRPRGGGPAPRSSCRSRDAPPPVSCRSPSTSTCTAPATAR